MAERDGSDGPSTRQTLELPPPFFIMGCQGSGNTLLGLILGRHSRLAVFLGSHYYPLFAADRRRYGDLNRSSNLVRLIRDFLVLTKARGVTAPDVHEILDTLSERTFEGVLSAFLHAYAHGQGKARVGERTSQHYLYLREILTGFAKSQVIFTIRDPRDIAFTIRAGLGTSVGGAIHAWNAAFAAYSHASRPVHLVRYEDLVRNPFDTITRICEFLEERYEPAMLRFFEATPEQFRTLPHHRRLFQPLDGCSVGEFRQMSAREIAEIEAGCAEGMEAVGYAFVRGRSECNETKPPAGSGVSGFLIDRVRYYGWSRDRRRQGWLRWKIVLRVRIRYLLSFGFLRKDW